jgi:hypothetical protein
MKPNGNGSHGTNGTNVSNRSNNSYDLHPTAPSSTSTPSLFTRCPLPYTLPPPEFDLSAYLATHRFDLLGDTPARIARVPLSTTLQFTHIQARLNIPTGSGMMALMIYARDLLTDTPTVSTYLSLRTSLILDTSLPLSLHTKLVRALGTSRRPTLDFQPTNPYDSYDNITIRTSSQQLFSLNSLADDLGIGTHSLMNALLARGLASQQHINSEFRALALSDFARLISQIDARRGEIEKLYMHYLSQDSEQTGIDADMSMHDDLAQDDLDTNDLSNLH